MVSGEWDAYEQLVGQVPRSTLTKDQMGSWLLEGKHIRTTSVDCFVTLFLAMTE